MGRCRSFGLVMDKSGKILLAPKSLGEGTKPAAHAERKGAALADKEALSRLRELQPAVLANSPMKRWGWWGWREQAVDDDGGGGRAKMR
eukprot:751027-Hanusia_phi.AAC.1